MICLLKRYRSERGERVVRTRRWPCTHGRQREKLDQSIPHFEHEPAMLEGGLGSERGSSDEWRQRHSNQYRVLSRSAHPRATSQALPTRNAHPPNCPCFHPGELNTSEINCGDRGRDEWSNPPPTLSTAYHQSIRCAIHLTLALEKTQLGL